MNTMKIDQLNVNTVDKGFVYKGDDSISEELEIR